MVAKYGYALLIFWCCLVVAKHGYSLLIFMIFLCCLMDAKHGYAFLIFLMFGKDGWRTHYRFQVTCFTAFYIFKFVHITILDPFFIRYCLKDDEFLLDVTPMEFRDLLALQDAFTIDITFCIIKYLLRNFVVFCSMMKIIMHITHVL